MTESLKAECLDSWIDIRPELLLLPMIITMMVISSHWQPVICSNTCIAIHAIADLGCGDHLSSAGRNRSSKRKHWVLQNDSMKTTCSPFGSRGSSTKAELELDGWRGKTTTEKPRFKSVQWDSAARRRRCVVESGIYRTPQWCCHQPTQRSSTRTQRNTVGESNAGQGRFGIGGHFPHVLVSHDDPRWNLFGNTFRKNVTRQCAGVGVLGEEEYGGKCWLSRKQSWIFCVEEWKGSREVVWQLYFNEGW